MFTVSAKNITKPTAPIIRSNRLTSIANKKNVIFSEFRGKVGQILEKRTQTYAFARSQHNLNLKTHTYRFIDNPIVYPYIRLYKSIHARPDAGRNIIVFLSIRYKFLLPV